MSALLSVEGLTRRFGGVVAVDDVSFGVREGEIVGRLPQGLASLGGQVGGELVSIQDRGGDRGRGRGGHGAIRL